MLPQRDDRSRSPNARHAWFIDHLDVAVIGVWLALAAIVVFLRRDFCGDGLRHIAPALTAPHPVLGEARWLLFPTLVYAVVHPLAVFGVVRDVEAAARVLALVNLALSAVYLDSLRRCLVALGVGIRSRAGALAVAAASAGLFFAATDLMEPMSAAAVAMLGLAFAAKRTHDPLSQLDRNRQATLVGVGLIAAAALFYQGVILAVGLIPVVVPRSVLRDRKLWLWAGIILALVPATMWVAGIAQGHGAVYAAARVLQPGDNPAYNSYLRRPGLGPRLAALMAGPVQGLVGLIDFNGARAIWEGLRTPGHRSALTNAALIICGDAILAAGTVAAIRRRDWALLTGLAAVLILPVVVRYQQYGYLKYYIMLPVVLAIAASRTRPAIAALIAGALLLVNTTERVSSVQAERAEYQRRVSVYAEAGTNSCWFTSGWGPRYGFRWPGHVCAALSSLQSYLGEGEVGLSGPHRALQHCLEDCFCNSTVVMTDDMTDEAKPIVRELADQFQFHAVDLAALTLRGDGGSVSRSAQESPVMRYPADEQRRLCTVIRNSPSSRPTP